MTTEPVPRRHRRRERRRSRAAGTETAPPAPAGGTSGEYAAPAGEAPVEGPPAGKDRVRRRFGRGSSPGGRAGTAGRVPGARAAGTAGTGAGAAGTAGAADAGAAETGTAGGAGGGPATPPEKVRPTRRPDLERGLRGIVGSGPSQVGVLGAMRARDAARPTAEDLAAAERDLVIVRRGWVPREDLPRTLR